MSEKSQLKGSSIQNRRRGIKAHATRLENQKIFKSLASSFSDYDKFQIETYGGIVERTVIRTPFNKDIAPSEISFSSADHECSRFAQVIAPENSEFTEFEGKQIQYLLTLDDVFLYPSPRGAFAELLDSGATIKTKLAFYTLGKRIVKEVRELAAA